MSTFPTITASQYAAATALVTPKLLIHVFIGSRLAVIARTGDKMTATDRLVNYSSIAIGAVVGAFTGWYIYRKTMARAQELEAEETNIVRDSSRRTGNIPRRYSDDPEAQVAAETLANDDDAIDYFDEHTTTKPTEYRDETTDDEDVFGEGDGDDELITASIGMHQQKR
jgi:hypothetical protein